MKTCTVVLSRYSHFDIGSSSFFEAMALCSLDDLALGCCCVIIRLTDYLVY